MTDAEKIAKLEREVERLKDNAKFWEEEFERIVSLLKAAPAMPTSDQLWRLPHSISQPGDTAKGKELQRIYGLGVVPPISEAETAAGAWFRITGGKCVVDTAQEAMSVSEIMNRGRRKEVSDGRC